MQTEIDVKTTVTVDLGDFPTRDLIDELEERGHAVDETEIESASVKELLDELAKRDISQFAAVDMRELIKALEYAGCPSEIIDDLKDWDNQPVPTIQKLEAWLSLAT